MIATLRGHALKALTPESAVTVDRSRCVRHRCSKNACARCVDVCQDGAVAWGGTGLEIDDHACTLCLRCLSVCPTAALASPELSLPRLLSDLAEHPRPVLGCHGRPETEANARMACLGLLAHPELMVLCALVFSEGLRLNLTACAGCANGHVRKGVETAHATMSVLVPDQAVDLVQDPDDLDFREPSMSRRQLFSLVRDRSTRAAATMVDRIQGGARPDSYGDKRVPEIRFLLLKALQRSSKARRRTIGDRLFGRVAFTSTCAGSGRCIGVCPTGAIQPRDDGGHPPDFIRHLCVSCDSCEAFCPNDGVRVERGDEVI